MASAVDNLTNVLRNFTTELHHGSNSDEDHHDHEHCHDFTSTKEVLFFANVIILLVIVALGK